MAWNEAVVTNDGLELLAKCVLGESVEITSAVGGETVSPAVSLMAIKEIAEPKHDLNIAKTERIKNGITVNVRTQNNGLAEGYWLRQIGLFARLEGNEAAPVLLAVIQDKDGEFVPKEEENPEYLLEYDFVIPINNTENISVSVTPNTFATLEDIEEIREHIVEPLKEEISDHIENSGKHITAEDRVKWNGKADKNIFDAHIENKSNPHAITKAQVGLGNVPNVVTNDQTPTYSESASVSNLTSGEKLSAALGKIAKAVRELISHMGDNVRHISAAERSAWNGKAASNHSHSAASASAAGFMSAADKQKLDGVAAGANNYAHPAYTGRTGAPAANQTPAFGGTFSITQPVSDGNGHITAMNSRTVKIPNNVASGSAAGLMSAADKNKVDGIKLSGINVTYGKETIPKATSGPISKTVTISHKTDIVFLWVLNHATYRTVIVLNSYANSEMLAGSFTVNLSQSTDSATLKFTGGTNLDTTVYYAAFRMS